MKHFLIAVFICILGLAGVAPSAFAAAPAVPSNADASRQPLPEIPDMAIPALEMPSKLTSSAPQLSDTLAKRTLTLHSVTFEGVSAFSDDILIQPFAPLLEKEITVQELFEAIAKVQQLYLDAAYTISRVDLPEQDITTGHIRIRVTEGYVADVEILDPDLQKSRLVQDIAKEIATMAPLDTRRLERLMMILSMRPGLETSAILAPFDPRSASEDNTGAIRVILKKQAQRNGTGYIEINNHGSAFLGPWRSRAGWRQGRIFGTDIDIGAAIALTPGYNELYQLSVDTQTPLFGASGSVGRLGFGKTLTRPGDNLKELDVKGDSENISLGISYPVILQRDQRWTFDTSFDYQNNATDLLSDRIFDDRLRTLTVGTLYSFHDDFSGINTLNLSYRQGFDILGVQENTQNLSRAEGKSDFSKVTAQIGRTQHLTGMFEALFGIEGQYAWDPLLSAEEFGYGGAHMGRAYDSSEIVGDKGVAASAEIRYTMQIAKPLPVILQPYTFYDIGKVWNIDPSDRSSQSGSSAGLGIRFGFPSGTSGNLVAAFPLTRKIDNPPKYSNENGPRILFSLQHNF